MEIMALDDAINAYNSLRKLQMIMKKELRRLEELTQNSADFFKPEVDQSQSAALDARLVMRANLASGLAGIEEALSWLCICSELDEAPEKTSPVEASRTEQI